MKTCVIYEVQVSKYRILELDQLVPNQDDVNYLIKGNVYEPVYFPMRPMTGIKADHYIVVESTESFIGETVEFI